MIVTDQRERSFPQSWIKTFEFRPKLLLNNFTSNRSAHVVLTGQEFTFPKLRFESCIDCGRY